jgi:acetolactate synthase I/II/III large subunit
MITCGELLVKCLEAFGVDTVFGIPGVHTAELYRGLPSTSIRHVSPRHEQGAGFMADGYARVTGKPGVCFIITGPGMTNIATAMAQAYGDSIPMLVISSVNNSEHLRMGGGRLHELPAQRDLIAGVSAFSHTLLRPDDLPAVLTRAFTIFGSGRPRPVHIEIPLDVITAAADHVVPKFGAVPSRPAPSPSAIEAAAHLLRSARQPVIFLGGGCREASIEARRLVEILDAPTACTINAKGVLPKHHTLSLGSNASFVPVRELVRNADVVLAIGTEMGETDYDLVFDGGLRIGGALIRIDIDAEQVNRNYPATIGIVSDAKLAILALLPLLDSGPPKLIPGRGAVLVSEVRRALELQWPPAWSAERSVLDIIQETLPDVIIVGDSTQPVYSGNHLFEAHSPGSWFNSATGYGALGYALPAAVGAKLGAPKRPILALVGDGGLMFSVSELASAIEAKTPIIVLLWNNQGYKEIKRYMEARGLPTIGVDIYTPDLLAIARGFGCVSCTAASFEDLRRLLREAAASTQCTIIEVREDSPFLTASPNPS